MENKRAVRVIGSLALKCHTVFRYARASSLPGLCLEAAISVGDALCAWHQLQNEQKRTESLKSMISEAVGKLEERNRAYRRDTELIVNEQRRLASEKLENLLWELKQERDSLQLQVQEAELKAKNKAKEVAAQEKAQNRVRTQISGYLQAVEEVIAASERSGREIPQSVMDQYYILLRRYKEWI